MPAVESKDGMLGRSAPDFNLKNIDGSFKNLQDCMGENGLVIGFICNHCPFVMAIQDRIIELTSDLQILGVNLVAINSNDAINFPDDSFDNMVKIAQQKKYPFPYLHDESQEIAKKYDVACTPEFYGLNSQATILYHGRLDDSGREFKTNSKRELYFAIEEIVKTGKAPAVQNPAIGCSIKWK